MNYNKAMDANTPIMGQNDEALAVQVFEDFCAASTMGKILALFREMCRILKLKPNILPDFYTKLKLKLAKSWRAQAIFKKLDLRSNFKIYNRGRICNNCRVLIIGGGPCGLRTAIDAQLLGAKVVVIEKRDRMTRNNIVHLWPFVIQDLRNLAAKKFFGKFCAGSIDHISIRQLQFMLLKVALILGVEFHESVSFEDILEPRDTGMEKCGWRASVTPVDHPVSNYEFDVLIGADGKRNTLQGFKRKEFRGKLAIAITANFINRHTKEEAAVPEISGTAFIFKQKFFLDLNKQFFIDLENLVYYKGETHYFVMTAKKQSLLQRQVLLKDYAETTSLLSRENINYAALREYAMDAAEYSTNFELPKLEFAVNHYGQPDVAVFDFTSMFAAENASRAMERLGYKLLVCLVGDGLLEPFWPTGSGCARGFLSSLDACWALRSWSMGIHPLAIIAERESIYRLLAQTTPQNVASDFSHYTVDPATRYRNLNKSAVLPHQITTFFDTDDPTSKQNIDLIEVTPQVHPKKRKRDSQVHPDTLLAWFKKQVTIFNLELDNVVAPFKNGFILCAVLHRYRPDLIDFNALDVNNSNENLKVALGIFEKEFAIPPIPDFDECIDKFETIDRTIIITYLSHVYYLFRGEIPFIRHAKTGSPEPDIKKRSSTPRTSVNKEPMVLSADIAARAGTLQSLRTSDSDNVSSQKKSRKRRSTSKYHGQSIAERLKKLREKRHHEEQKRRELARSVMIAKLDAKSMKMLESNAKPQSSFCVDEDYDIYSYRQNAPEFKSRVKSLEKLLYPDHERPTGPVTGRGNLGGEFSSKLKCIEDQLTDGSAGVVAKKPRDLLRAIGKIESSDWNFKQIEEKIQENQLGRSPAHGKEKVPKWNREQFLARQTKIVGYGTEITEDNSGKFQEIDSSLKQLDRQLKEGHMLETGERGKNKVASLAGQFTKKTDNDDQQTLVKVKNDVKPIKINPGRLDICHTCKKKVYLMEKICPEDNFVFHKNCFKCYYCSLTLKMGSYSYDRDGRFGHNFFCLHHFGFVDRVIKTPVNVPNYKQLKDKKNQQHELPTHTVDSKTPIQILKRGETPERIELVNQMNPIDDFDEMDEDEWSDINFGNSLAIENESSGNGDEEESSSSEDDFSEIEEGQDDDSDNDNVSDSQGSDVGSDEEYSSDSSDRSCHEYSSGDEDGGSGTEGSEQREAREQRRQEVAIRAPPVTSSPTDTEVASDEESSSKDSEAANSATEVSTDSEFAHDDPTPTRELPAITFSDEFVCKTRGNYSKQNELKKIGIDSDSKARRKKAHIVQCRDKSNDFAAKVHVKTKFIVNGNTEKRERENTGIHLELQNIAPVEMKIPVVVPRIGDYLLSRTQSTSGIATKRALELKKKYLLGPQASVGLQKSDSASQLDTKLKNFHSNISECQKLLNPAKDISPSMQAFLENSSKRNGGLLSPTNMNLLPINNFDMNSAKQKLSLFNFSSNVNSDSSNNLPVTQIENLTESNYITSTKTTPILNIDQKNSNDSTVNFSIDKNPCPTKSDIKESLENDNNSKQVESQSPLLETSIMVPNIPWKKTKTEEFSGTDMESDSLLCTDSSSEEHSTKDNGQDSIAIPRLEIRKPCGEVMQLDSLMNVGSQGSEEENPETSGNSWSHNNNQIVETVNTQILNDCLKPVTSEDTFKSDGHASPNSDSGNDITAFFTDNEPLDWAVDGSTIDIECNTNNATTGHRHNRKQLSMEVFLQSDFDASEHVCGKGLEKKIDASSSNILACDHSDIDFMDTGSEESLIENLTTSKNRESLVNRGFVEFVEVGMDNSVINPVKPQIIEAVNHHCDSPVNDRSMDFIEQGACVLNNDTYLNNILKDNVFDKNVIRGDLNQCDTTQFILKKNIDFNSNSREIPTIVSENIDCDDLHTSQILNDNEIKPIYDKSDNIINNEDESKCESKTSKNNIEDFSKSISDSSDNKLSKKACNSPKTSRKLEEITKEKVKQKDVIHQLVMDRMSKNSNNTEKRLNRRSRSSINPETFGKRFNLLSNADNDRLNCNEINVDGVNNGVKDQMSRINVKLKLLNDENVDYLGFNCLQKGNSPYNAHGDKAKMKYPNNSEAFSLPDLPQAVRREYNSGNVSKNFNSTAVASDTKDFTEKSIMAKEVYEMPTCHQTGIVPGFRQLSLDDCSGKLVQDVKSLRKTDSCFNNDMVNVQSMSYNNLYSNDVNPFGSDNINKKSKHRDSERRKSIIKTVSDFFKRRDSTGQLTNIFGEKKNRLQKDKYKSKDHNSTLEEAIANPTTDDETIPPPIPPLPTNIGQFSGESDKYKENPSEHAKNPCLLAFERQERIKKIRYNIKSLETKESETKEQYDELISSIRKNSSYPTRQETLRLSDYKRHLRMIQFQRKVENFLVEDLLLEDKYYELRLKSMKSMQTRRESNTAKMINKDMIEIVNSRRILGEKLRDLTARYHSKEAEDDVMKHDLLSISKDSSTN